MNVHDSLQLIELDKGSQQLGPLFEEPRRRLQDDPAFRRAWAQYQALRALAWEAAPDLDARLIRQGLQASRRQEVERRLARTTGSQDAARELLLEPQRDRKNGLPAWAAFLLLAGALGLGWMAFGPKLGAPDAGQSASPMASPATVAPNGEGPMAFEFPIQTPPAQAALDMGTPPASDETRAENPDAREARRLVNENLREAAEPKEAAPRATAKAVATPHPAPTKPLPLATEAVTVAVAVADVQPSPAPSPLDTPQPTPAVQPIVAAVPSATTVPTANFMAPERLEGDVGSADLALSGARFPATATLSLPDSGAVDLRLFDMRGRLVRRYAEGDQAAGVWRYALPATDEQGRPLPAGSYYLRVICRWFSKVEALEQP